MRHGIVLCFVVAFLCACEPSVALTSSSHEPTVSQPHNAQVSLASDVKSEESPLLRVLKIFASADGKRWAAYVPTSSGVTWLDKQPQRYADDKYDRGGRLLLKGFGTVKLPNGKVGAEYNTKDGNEGLSGVTLDGDAVEVTGLSVKKFYFTKGYKDVLKRQLGPESKVVEIAMGCLPEDDSDIESHNEFFRVSLPDGDVIYAEAFIEAEEKYSPGSTIFDFEREFPVRRLAELRCQQHHP
jgi:hypothetical protein